MNDKLSASWVLVVGTVFIAYYYYRTKGKSSGQKVDSGAYRSSIGGASGTVLQRLEDLANQFGLPITSTAGGQHAEHSLHYAGRAIDVGTRGASPDIISQFIDAAKRAGFRVLDERYTGSGPYGPSTGPHLHVDLPFQRSSFDIDNQLSQEVG